MGALEVAYSARLVVLVAMCAGVRRVNECEAAMSMELTNTRASDTAHGAEGSAPVARRDPQWVETVLTVMVTSVVVIMVSILAVAMNLI
jgi:hypothetical protein